MKVQLLALAQPTSMTEQQPYLLATFAVGGFTGVATQVVTLSAGVLCCRLLQEGWHRAECRPNIALLSIVITVRYTVNYMEQPPLLYDVRCASVALGPGQARLGGVPSTALVILLRKAFRHCI